MSQTGDTRIANDSIFSNGAYFFSIYSGRTRSEGAYAEDLYQYDWTGALKAHYKFDRPILSCTVTENSNILYCIDSSSGLPEIVEYKLPKAFP